MIILFLDDQDIRHECAEKHFSGAGHKVLHAYSPTEALEIVMSCKARIGLMCLDHDLGIIAEDSETLFGVERIVKKEVTGLDFVKGLITLPQDKLPARAIVHSYNNDGARNMIQLLTSVGIHSQHRTFCGDLCKELCEELKPQ
jgi:CheY-like chemotaxis protein